MVLAQINNVKFKHTILNLYFCILSLWKQKTLYKRHKNNVSFTILLYKKESQVELLCLVNHKHVSGDKDVYMRDDLGTRPCLSYKNNVMFNVWKQPAEVMWHIQPLFIALWKSYSMHCKIKATITVFKRKVHILYLGIVQHKA